MTAVAVHDLLADMHRSKPDRLYDLGFVPSTTIHFVAPEFRQQDALDSMESGDKKVPLVLTLHSSSEENCEFFVLISLVKPVYISKGMDSGQWYLDWYYEGFVFNHAEGLRLDGTMVRIYAAIFRGDADLSAIAWQFIDRDRQPVGGG